MTTTTRLCALADLVPERGAVALIDGVQIALIRTYEDTVHAVANIDPYSGAPVISRGLIGTRGDIPTVTSPMYKQVFDLRTGACLDSVGREVLTLCTWPVGIVDGQVEIEVDDPPEEATQAPFGGRVA